jgi:anti-sigma-K factor RskA
MTSSSIHDDVEAYALGALDANASAAFEQHLGSCSACQHEIASYAGVLTGLRQMPIPAPGPFPSAKLTSWRTRIARPLGVAAAAVLALGLSYAGGMSRQAASSPEPEAVLRMVANASTDLRSDRGSRHERVLVGGERKETAIIVAGLTPVDSGYDYQVWIDGKSPGLLRRMRDGVEVLIIRGDPVQGAHKIGISREQSGGSDHRTTASLISLDVHQG